MRESCQGPVEDERMRFRLFDEHLHVLYLRSISAQERFVSYLTRHSKLGIKRHDSSSRICTSSVRTHMIIIDRRDPTAVYMTWRYRVAHIMPLDCSAFG